MLAPNPRFAFLRDFRLSSWFQARLDMPSCRPRTGAVSPSASAKSQLAVASRCSLRNLVPLAPVAFRHDGAAPEAGILAWVCMTWVVIHRRLRSATSLVSEFGFPQVPAGLTTDRGDWQSLADPSCIQRGWVDLTCLRTYLDRFGLFDPRWPRPVNIKTNWSQPYSSVEILSNPQVRGGFWPLDFDLGLGLYARYSEQRRGIQYARIE